MSKELPIIISKGLSGVTSSDNPDFEIWRKKHEEDLYHYSFEDAKRIYKNGLFMNKYGEEKFNSLSPEERDSLYELDEINTYIQDNYSKDKRFNEIQGLTLEGKRELINSEYKNPNELESFYNSATENVLNSTPVKPKEKEGFWDKLSRYSSGISSPTTGGAYDPSTTALIQNAGARKRIEGDQEHILGNIIENDKERKVEKVSGESKNIMEAYTQEINNGNISIEEVNAEIDKVFSGYTTTIDTPDGSVDYKIPGSNYYNVFKDSRWLEDLSQEEKLEYYSKYQAIANKYGLADAIYYLDSELQKRIADKQNWFTATYKTAWQTTANGVLPDMIGTILTIPSLFMDEDRANEYLQNNVEYFNNVSKYGTWKKDLINEAEANGGISQRKIVWNKDQENSWISGKTFVDVAEQSKWLMEMAITSYITGGVGGVLSKGLRASAKTASLISNSTKVLNKIDKAVDKLENVGRLSKLAFDTAPVSYQESYGVLEQTRDNNYKVLDSKIYNSAVASANEMIKSNKAQKAIEQMANNYILEIRKNNPNIKPEDINIEAVTKQAEQEYLTYLIETNKNILRDSYNEEYELADQMSIDAFKTAYWLSTIKTAGVNTVVRGFLETLPFRQAIKAPTPKVKTKIGKDGLLEEIPMSTYKKYYHPIVKNTLGEGADEVADELIAAFSTGYGTTKFEQYLNPNENYNVFDKYVASILGGIASTTDALTEENTWKAGFLGGISGVSNMFFNIGKKQDPINGENYTFLEKINNVVTNPILHDILENKYVEAQTKKRIASINEVLKKYSTSYTDISKLLEDLNGYNGAVILGDVETASNLRLDSAINLMSTLKHLSEDEALSSSKIVENVNQIIQNAAEGKISDEEINSFIGNVKNKGFNISQEEAKSRIQENAQKLISISEKLESTRKSLKYNSNFTSLNSARQEDIIKSIIATEDKKERVSSIRTKLGLPTEPKPSIVAGSVKHIDALIENLKKKYRTLQSFEFSDDYDDVPTTRKARKILKREIEKSLNEIRHKEKALKQIPIGEDGYTRTLTAEEIKSLDNESLEIMLNPNNSVYFSQEQKEVIEQVKEELSKNIASSDLTQLGVSEYAGTLSSLELSAQLTERMTDAVLTHGLNGEALLSLFKKENAIDRNIKIENNLESSINELVYAVEGNITDDIPSLIKEVTSYPKHIINRYIEKNRDTLPKHILDALNTAIEKINLKEDFIEATNTLQVSGDIAKLVRDSLITIVEDNSTTTKEEAVEKIKDLLTTSNLDEEFKNTLHEVLSNLGVIIENDNIRERIEEPIISDDKSGEVIAPPTPVDVKVTEDKEQLEKSKITDPVYEVTKDGGEKIVSEKPNEYIQIANNVINNISRFSDEVKKKAREILEYASESSTAQELADYLNAEANRLDALSIEEGDFNTSDLLRQCAVRIMNISQKQSETEEKQKKEPVNIFDRHAQLASTIESVDMDDIVKRYPDGPLSKFYIKYKVRDFLTSGTISNNTPVVFITDPDLTREVEESMKNSGLNYTVNSMPIIAAVEVESGGITIGDNHYQPIAIMPATDSQTRQGAARLSEIRKLAYIQSNETAQLVKTEDGTVITTSISGTVNADKLPQLPETEPNRSVQTLQINDLQDSERREISNMSKSERRSHPIYQRIKNYFLSRLKSMKKDKEDILVYELDNLKGEKIPYQAFITPSHKTVDRNSNRLIVDLLKENNHSALRSNSRIIRYLYELNRFFSNTFNTEEFAFDQDENGNIVADDKTRSALETYASKLDSILGNFLNLPTREGWHYQLTPTRVLPNGKVEVSLSLINNNGNTINLGNITEGSISEDTQFDIIKNLFIDSSTGEVRMRDSKYAFVKWNVKYSDAGNSESNAKNNIADIYDDDIIEFSKSSLQYSIRGVTINAPFTLDGKLKPFTPDTRKNQGTSTEQQVEEKVEQEAPAIEIQQGGTVVEGNSVFDSNTGVVIEGEVKQPNEVQTSKEEKQESSEQVEQKEAKPIRRLKDRRIKSTKPALTQQSTNPKYAWGKFEGAKMSVQEITEALNAQQIFTEEDWNSRTEQEKERVLKCCGAI